MEAPLLPAVNGDDVQDYEPVKSWKDARSVTWKETQKLWKIAGPIAFTIICNFGTNSVSTMFVGHLGNVQLSAVSIALSVIGTFSFGFLLSKDIWAFVKLSLESAVMLCLEIWYMMSIIILTGHLGNAVISVDSLSICMNLNGWEAMLFIGINAAISVRVSNELGLGRPRAAKYAVCVTVLQSLLIGIVCMIVILITKDYFSVIFTSNAELQQAVAKLAFLLGITMVLNSVQPVISGVAIGGGWQGLVAYINLGCYYVFGLPLGFLLGYKANWGVKGIWGGMICGTALQTLLLLIVLYRTNWNKEVEQSSERMKKWGGQNVEDEKIANNRI
ncbi:transparent testa 12 [Prunus yedoensis var. nudiflora]|uniref:Transparent testa 12 n=1 Tax=Prunus yedoensis var. nudiflora TaxID=2094558 RepID=A0A315B2N0_PRUYE|nr:transparent testa 12 [Prunus yedoensis var. nudiflora]